MKRWTMLSAMSLLGMALVSPATAQNAADDSNSVAIGDISKIDSRGKSLTINNAVSYNIAPAISGRGARGGAGAGRPGGGRRGGSGGGASRGSGGFVPQAPRTFKIVGSKAQFKQDDQPIHFTDLKIGDHIEVLGQTKGSKIEASEIIRMQKARNE